VSTIVHAARSMGTQIVGIMRTQAEERQIELDVELQDVLPTLHADHARLTQVLFNSIGNALKFTPAGGRVLIRAERTENGARFSVSDTGPGISESQRDSGSRAALRPRGRRVRRGSSTPDKARDHRPTDRRGGDGRKCGREPRARAERRLGGAPRRPRAGRRASRSPRSEVVTTTPDTPLADAARLMLDRQIGCLVVLEGEEIARMLTEGDFVRLAQR